MLRNFLLAGILTLNQVVFAYDPGKDSIHQRSASADNWTQKVATLHVNPLARAQSSRKAGDYVLAISIYRELIMADPNNLNARLELASILTYLRKFDEARAELDFVRKSRPRWTKVHLAFAELEQQAGNEISALKAFDRVLNIDPENRIAIEGKILTLSRLGSSELALAEARKYLRLNPQIVQRLHEDKAAQAIRRSENAYYNTSAHNLIDFDVAISLIEENLKRYPESERSRFDYVRALTNRRRYGEAIDVYERLINENRDVAGYVHQSAGSAYLALQQPKRASKAYRSALQKDADDFNANVGLFYALSDLTKFKQAKTHIDALATRPLDAEKKFEIEILGVWARAYEDRLGVAQQRFSELQRRAPANNSLRNALARVYLWRGWPRRSGEEFNLVHQLHPEDMEAKAGLMEVAMALGDYHAATHRLEHLKTSTQGENETVKRLTRAHEVWRGHEINLYVGTSQNKERASTGQSIVWDTRLDSAPIGSQHRLFAHQYYESSHFDAGTAYYKRLGVGLTSVLARTAKLEIEIQKEFFRSDRIGTVFSGETLLSDYWRIHSRYATDSIDVPLRARVNDIQGKSISLGGSYRWNERIKLNVGAQHLAMTDDNDRRNLSIAGEYRFIQGPFYKADVALEVNTSTNTLLNTVYFNPARDRTVLFTLRNEWLGYRRYARSFSHRLHLSAGGYVQEGYEPQSIGSVRYENEWHLSDAFNVLYGLAYIRRVFDGEPSIGPEAALSVNWKF